MVLHRIGAGRAGTFRFTRRPVARGRGEIGRRRRLKISFLMECGFESRRPHQHRAPDAYARRLILRPRPYSRGKWPEPRGARSPSWAPAFARALRKSSVTPDLFRGPPGAKSCTIGFAAPWMPEHVQRQGRVLQGSRFRQGTNPIQRMLSAKAPGRRTADDPVRSVRRPPDANADAGHPRPGRSHPPSTPRMRAPAPPPLPQPGRRSSRSPTRHRRSCRTICTDR